MFAYLIWCLCVCARVCTYEDPSIMWVLGVEFVLGDGHLYPPSHLAAQFPLVSSDIFDWCVVVSF